MISLPDIIGDNAVHQIKLVCAVAGVPYGAKVGDPVSARWVQIVATGSGTLRIGGAEVSSTQGIPCTAVEGGQFMPPFSSGSLAYPSSEFSAYIPTGATLSVAFKEW